MAWLSALPVSSKRSPGDELPSARYQRPLGSQTYREEKNTNGNDFNVDNNQVSRSVTRCLSFRGQI